MVYTPTAIEPQTPPQEAPAAGTPQTGAVALRTVAVVGLGYVGLPLAVALARHFETVGFDIDSGRVAELARGHDRTGEVEAHRLAGADRRHHRSRLGRCVHHRGRRG